MEHQKSKQGTYSGTFLIKISPQNTCMRMISRFWFRHIRKKNNDKVVIPSKNPILSFSLH